MRTGSLKLFVAFAVLYGYGGCNGNGSPVGANATTASTSNTTNTTTSNTSNTTNTTTTNTSNTDPTNINGTSTATDPHVQFALDQINAAREANGAGKLTLDPSLTQVALRHSQDLAACANNNTANIGQCAHKSFAAGDTGGAVSENQGYETSVTQANQDPKFKSVNDLFLSEGAPPAGTFNHYSNLMDPARTAAGLGLYIDPNGNLWVTEMFK